MMGEPPIREQAVGRRTDGLHAAEAEPRNEGDYFGLALSRCARLRALAHATRGARAAGSPPATRATAGQV